MASSTIHSIDPCIELRKDESNEKKESPSKILIQNLLEKKAPLAAIITKNLDLLDEILKSDRFEKLKISKQQPENGQNVQAEEAQENEPMDTKENGNKESGGKNADRMESSKTESTALMTNPLDTAQMELNQAMLTAISSKQPEMLEKILAACADIHAFDNWYPVLISIADMNSLELFEVAIKYAKNINVTGHYGNLLHAAVRSSSLTLLEKVYELGIKDFSNCRANGSTPLHEAVRNVPYIVKKPVCEKETKEKEQQSNSKDPQDEAQKSKNTLTLSDIEINYDLRILNFLLEKGCPIDSTDLQQKTALHIATILGNKAAVKCLVKAGANKRLVDAENNTPFMYSAIYSHDNLWEDVIDIEEINKPLNDKAYLIHLVCEKKLDKALQFLLDKGADPLVTKSHNSETPLMTAVMNNAEKCIKVLLNQPDCGINTKCVGEQSPFHTTLSHFYSYTKEIRDEVLDLFLRKGAIIDEENEKGESILLQIMDSNIEASEWLLVHGANPDHMATTGCYPLYVACYNASLELLNMLLKYNADVTITDRCENDLTPLQITMERKSFSVTKRCLVAGFSLHLIHDWFNIEQDLIEDICQYEPRYKALVNYIKNTSHEPMSLRGLARMKVLKCIGVQDKNSKISKLGLPIILEDYLDWEKYIEAREFEMDRYIEKFQNM